MSNFDFINVFNISIRWLTNYHFVETTSQTPDIAFEVIRLIRYNLWAQIVRCAHDGLSLVYRFVQNLGNAKVTKFYNSIIRQKYILCFQISVQNLAIMHMLHRQADLGEPIKNLIFRHIASSFSLLFNSAL